jgi:hypothetical protein
MNLRKQRIAPVPRAVQPARFPEREWAADASSPGKAGTRVETAFSTRRRGGSGESTVGQETAFSTRRRGDAEEKEAKSKPESAEEAENPPSDRKLLFRRGDAEKAENPPSDSRRGASCLETAFSTRRRGDAEEKEVKSKPESAEEAENPPSDSWRGAFVWGVRVIFGVQPKAYEHGQKCTWPKICAATRQEFNSVGTDGRGSDHSAEPVRSRIAMEPHFPWTCSSSR